MLLRKLPTVLTDYRKETILPEFLQNFEIPISLLKSIFGNINVPRLSNYSKASTQPECVCQRR